MTEPATLLSPDRFAAALQDHLWDDDWGGCYGCDWRANEALTDPHAQWIQHVLDVAASAADLAPFQRPCVIPPTEPQPLTYTCATQEDAEMQAASDAFVAAACASLQRMFDRAVSTGPRDTPTDSIAFRIEAP